MPRRWGAGGRAASTGRGLALARPERRVLVVTGDGEMLMGLGSLATIGVQKPANLTGGVIDNERYGETASPACRRRIPRTAWTLPPSRRLADSANRGPSSIRARSARCDH